MNTSVEIVYRSPLGPLQLGFSRRGLCSLKFATSRSGATPSPLSPVMKQTVQWLDQYFAGKNPPPLPFKTFDLEGGTTFQKQVWRGLSQISFGEVVSYADLAKAVRNPKACRAVGNANGKNPIPILIPCHRVIAADGSLGGYSCGLDRKRKLLKLEGISL